MAARNWTQEQKDAIGAEGTLLVSAAAGSGKTAVLVERVIRKISEGPNPVDADRLLVMTYTNAAAAEMKERISARIHEMIEKDPDNLTLQRQQILLQNAQISTIHSFCLDLIRENFEKLDVPPDFRMADDGELNLLLRDTLDVILEERYERDLRGSTMETLDSRPFILLSEMLSSGRDDRPLVETVIRLYTFLRSLPDPEGWLRDKLRMYEEDLPLAKTLWGRRAAAYVRSVLLNGIARTRAALEEIHGDAQLEKAYAPAFESDLAALGRALEAADGSDWDTLRSACAFSFERLGPLRKFEDAALKERVKAARDDVKGTLKGLAKGVLCCSQAEYDEDRRAVYPAVRELFSVVQELGRRLFEEKLKKNVLDFSDLEQLALRLLTEVRDGRTEPSATARRVAARFDEILVDEYQDTNLTQDAIFRAVSRNGENLFMVGDVKQSIYRFRQAMPEIFIEKKERFAPFRNRRAGGTEPAKIILGRNFRSRKGVADAVNFVFDLLMSREMGEIEYGTEDELIPAAVYPAREGADFALHILDCSKGGDEEGRDVLEARHIGRTIRRMVEEHDPLLGPEGPRPARFRDFCVLMRGTAGRTETYMRELTACGVPVYAEAANGYLGSYEVEVVLNFLRVLDNPLQDVALLSVMMSTAFGFTPDDLAAIRGDRRKRKLYLSFVDYAQTRGGKSARFLEMLTRLRELAAVLPVDKLILKIYHLTSFLSAVTVMPGGEKRRANLRLLLDYARKYETAGYAGLSGFVRFIDRLSDKSGDLAPASVLSESADVVRLMSIHKSKGLEFPVCFLAGCSRSFNRMDLNQPALFHPFYGFGTLRRDPELGCRFTTLPKEVIRLETANSTLSEEMRVLYVAMTRAKEKLIAVAALSDPEAALKKAAAMTAREKNAEGVEKLLPFNVSRAGSYAEWLLACALCHPSGGRLRTAAGLSGENVLPCASPWEIELVPAAGAPAGEGETAARPVGAGDEAETRETVRRIAERLSFRYRWGALSRIPSKISVSEVAEAAAQPADEAYPAGRLEEGRPPFRAGDLRPSFLSGEELTGAEKGTALHAFMQYARFDEIRDEAQVRQECRRLEEQGFLLGEQARSVAGQSEKILNFLHSELYARIAGAKRVYREFRFNLDTPAVSLYNKEAAQIPAGESVLLQGMADLIFETEDGCYLLDYKTDRVGNGGEDELVRRYGTQLRIYAKAVEEMMEKTVKAAYLYAFALDKAIKI